MQILCGLGFIQSDHHAGQKRLRQQFCRLIFQLRTGKFCFRFDFGSVKHHHHQDHHQDTQREQQRHAARIFVLYCFSLFHFHSAHLLFLRSLR